MALGRRRILEAIGRVPDGSHQGVRLSLLLGRLLVMR